MFKALKGFVAAVMVAFAGLGTLLQYSARNIEQARVDSEAAERVRAEEDQKAMREVQGHHVFVAVDTWRKYLKSRTASQQQEQQSQPSER